MWLISIDSDGCIVDIEWILLNGKIKWGCMFIVIFLSYGYYDV